MRSFLLLSLIVIAVSLTSCESQTIINTKPPGARLYADGQFKGLTPCVYSDTKILGAHTRIRLTHEGYADFNGLITRDEHVSILNAALCFLCVPLFWVQEYNPEHTYFLIPESTPPPPVPAPAAPTAKPATDSSKSSNAAPATPAPPPPPDPLEVRLSRLKKMLDDGTISKQEYDQLRKKAMDGAK